MFQINMTCEVSYLIIKINLNKIYIYIYSDIIIHGNNEDNQLMSLNFIKKHTCREEVLCMQQEIIKELIKQIVVGK